MNFPFIDSLNNSEKQIKVANSRWRIPGDYRYHFIGIGGVAMGNVAADLVKSSFRVTGSDMGVYSPMKEYLADNGISPLTPFNPENLDQADLVIVGNAISRGNPELEAVLNRRMQYTSLPEFLRWGLLSARKNLVITGTHGKTTITALASYIFERTGFEPGFMVGGIPLNFATGFRSGAGEYFVIEGDEYDIAFFDKRAKFLQYLPFAAVINCIEFDHGDIYRDLGEIVDAFRKFIRLIPENGFLIVNAEDQNINPLIDEARCKVVRFGNGTGSDFRAEAEKEKIRVIRRGKEWGEFNFIPPGRYNMMNALAAIALTDSLGLEKDKVIPAMENFRGVRRRMELIYDAKGVTIIDDFAHHPTAVEAAIRAVKERYPAQRLWAVFQPRSNTSVTNVFQDEWVKAFAEADLAVIAELHRRDKIPVEKRLSRDKLREELIDSGVETYLWNDADEIVGEILPRIQSGDVILIMSNSDFGGLPGKLKMELES